TATPTTSFTPTRTPTFTPTATAPFTPTPTPFLLSTPTPTSSPTGNPCVVHAWPNPFPSDNGQNDPLNVSCVPDDGTVDFYTLSGELVRRVLPLSHIARWDGRNLRDVPCSSGIYSCVIVQNGHAVVAGKVMLLNGNYKPSITVQLLGPSVPSW